MSDHYPLWVEFRVGPDAGFTKRAPVNRLSPGEWAAVSRLLVGER